jgi:DDB1- and CUL4-associated factor 6
LTFNPVSYLGLREEYVASGSDDGNLFVWNRATGEIVNILEGDEDVVNVIEGNPRFQACAVSGIDHTVKVSNST